MNANCKSWLKSFDCCLKPTSATEDLILMKVTSLRVTLLKLAPTLGQRVHFAEGTNLRCREDPIPSDSQERSAIHYGLEKHLFLFFLQIMFGSRLLVERNTNSPRPLGGMIYNF
ncbi:hypothetical protein DMN91_005562 [Ooceraea biroi]|uniref:Uncharacterized protein n=1 Tax=Ooceraea biroi TaxID=2015173 RepID=A0A3L8DMN6_OOCBI|nr:uncharacterized protein LOC105284542 [Ooceraea biroi]RLU21189.1 hypothetical protein DMN91_005562 [Ooceraea biroi]